MDGVGVNMRHKVVGSAYSNAYKSCVEHCDENRDCSLVEQFGYQDGWDYRIKCILFSSDDKYLPALQPPKMTSKIDEKLKDELE